MMRRLTISFAILQIVLCSCPPGFDLIHDETCAGYYATVPNVRCDEALNVAVDKCKEINGQPVIIHNSEDQAYWTDLVAERPNRVVLGLTCDSSSRKFKWVDGTAMDYKPPIGNYNTKLDGDCQTGCVVDMCASTCSIDGFWQYYCNGETYTYDIFCTTRQILPAPNNDGCEIFEDDSEDGVCYQVSAAPQNWRDAQVTCRNFGGNLASIHNLQENSFIRRLAVSKGALNGVFLGATISGKGNQFGWIDGSEWDYDHFYHGFPVNGLGDCVVMDVQGGTTGEWVNVDCSSNFSVACIREQNYTTNACYRGSWQEGQIIVSPGYPFDASVPCDYMLTVDAGKRVEVEVILLEANSCCDHLILTENYIGGTVLANLTGLVKDQKYTTSSSNFMRVAWEPNGGVNVRGLMMTFRGV